MTTWTVVTILDPYGPDHIGAVRGRVDAYGYNVHTAVVAADTADDAINTVREAFRVVGADRINPTDQDPPHADRWTVIGLASNGACAIHNTVAVIAGEHEVHGRRDSPLSHRWTRAVDAPTATEADQAGYKAAADQYNTTWD